MTISANLHDLDRAEYATHANFSVIRFFDGRTNEVTIFLEIPNHQVVAEAVAQYINDAINDGKPIAPAQGNPDDFPF